MVMVTTTDQLDSKFSLIYLFMSCITLNYVNLRSTYSVYATFLFRHVLLRYWIIMCCTALRCFAMKRCINVRYLAYYICIY